MIFSKAINLFSRFSRREIFFLSMLIATVFIVLVLEVVISPVLRHREKLTQSIDIHRQQMKEIAGLTAEHDLIRQQVDRIKTKVHQRTSDFTLFSFLNRLAGQAGIQANIVYMKPSRSTTPNQSFQISVVEIKLQAISLAQLVTWLHHIETSGEMITIKTASISKSETPPDRIDAIIQAQTIEP
ncbi:MAG: type II secretion system protein GspM [Desulfatirhabdiaceae bacterium]